METHIEFKRKIDNARNILVGAVPSPAGQIDQITYALIYKFMSDIDDKSTRLPGGTRQYFVDGFEKYDWHNLMRLDGQDKLNRYRDALSKMRENPHLPETFRSLYQNAFLPYNDPRTLNLFLKEIDGFVHTKSDAIGDAYEYLLSITGAQGDVGQFRTPRHIIKFIVDIVQPGKNESVLDPACGTAGFLIAAYNYVRQQHDGFDEDGNQNGEKRLSADERKTLHGNYFGYDIDPTMVRTATVNMYLHGFPSPNIEIYDSLTQDDHWQSRFDVIIANPPFMTPKGGIQPHGKFGIKANRAEVLFVDYIASHLKPNGRAGIVVPEGIIFQSGKAYKELRKNLVENSLYAVVSLPSGVFMPYTGVKTSILLLDKDMAKQRDEVLFINIEHVGISLGATGRKIDSNDLPHALNTVKRFKNGEEITQSPLALVAQKSEIRNSSTYDLKQSLYRVMEAVDSEIEFVTLDSITEINKGKSSSTKTRPGEYPLVLTAEEPKTSESYDFNGEGVAVPLISALGHGKAEVKRIHRVSGKFALANLLCFLEPKDTNTVDPDYLFYILDAAKTRMAQLMSGAANVSMNINDVRGFKIPLPPIEIQREIVAELNGYQRIIDSAQTIIQTYKPTIKINPEWGIQTLNDATEVRDGTHDSPKYVSSDGYPLITSKNLKNGTLDFTDINLISRSDLDAINRRSHVDDGDILVPMIGTIGGAVRVKKDREFAIKNVALIKPRQSQVDMSYISYLLNSEYVNNVFTAAATGGTQKFISLGFLRKLQIPLPPIEIQREIVAEFEAEQRLINANKKLIEIYQQKIKSKVAEIWGV